MKIAVPLTDEMINKNMIINAIHPFGMIPPRKKKNRKNDRKVPR